MLAACGGGGGDDKPSSSPTSSAEPSASAPGGGNGTPGDSGNAGGGNNGGGNAGGGNNGGGNNGGGGASVKPLTYSQLSTCPAAMEPLVVDKIGCVKGYFDGKIFEVPEPPSDGGFAEQETSANCRLAIGNDGAITFTWNGEVSMVALTLQEREERIPDGLRFWRSSLSTQEDNDASRKFTLTSGYGEVSVGEGGMSGLNLEVVQDKGQKTMTVVARDSLPWDFPFTRSCRAVLR